MGIFTKRDKPIAEPPPPSEAQAHGLRPPPNTKEHRAGLDAALAISQQKSDRRLKQYEAEWLARKQATDAHEHLFGKKALREPVMPLVKVDQIYKVRCVAAGEEDWRRLKVVGQVPSQPGEPAIEWATQQPDALCSARRAGGAGCVCARPMASRATRSAISS
jgi:hypothetical protein